METQQSSIQMLVITQKLEDKCSCNYQREGEDSLWLAVTLARCWGKWSWMGIAQRTGIALLRPRVNLETFPSKNIPWLSSKPLCRIFGGTKPGRNTFKLVYYSWNQLGQKPEDSQSSPLVWVTEFCSKQSTCGGRKVGSLKGTKVYSVSLDQLCSEDCRWGNVLEMSAWGFSETYICLI